METIKKLCGRGTHVNIVEVLNHGLLSNFPYYFIDMELCDFNLYDYIHQENPPRPSESIPYFLKGAGSASVLQIWTVMSQIASGVEFVHRQGHIHRDIKPGNGNSLSLSLTSLTDLVLYSCKSSTWKLADFGLSTEGSSKTNRPTRYGRGSSGYRAPELMATDEEPLYNNKVDIWSMGCILYELATRTCAFKTDWAVLEYRYSGKDKDVILDETFDEYTNKTIAKHVVDMLQIDATVRPSATTLSKDFIRHRQVTQASNHITDHLNSTVKSVRLGAVPDVIERKLPTPQKDPVIINEPENNAHGPTLGLTGVPLYRVAKDGDVEMVKMLLNENKDVNPQGGKYGNPLQAAARNGHLVIVQLLLKKGADVNAQGGFYGNALQAASINGHEAVVRSLLEEGADVNAGGGYHGNALQAAAASGNIAVVLLLLEKNADVNAYFEGKYSSALQVASRQGHEAVVRLLVEKGADVNARGGVYNTALQAAARNGNETVVRLLLEKGADVNAVGGTYGNALRAASERGNVAVVQVLLENGGIFDGGTES